MKFFASACLAAALFTAQTPAFAQQPAATPPPPSGPQVQTRLSVDDVIKMTKAGLGEDLIITQVKANGTPFNLSTDQLISLHAAGVSDRVIATMVNPLAAPAPAAAGPGAASPANSEPTEVGVYILQNGSWVEMEPEVVNYKTGGVLKSVFTDGIVKGDKNGHLNGAHSKTTVTLPTQFLFVTPEGTSATEYQLIRLRQNSDNREFRSVTGGVFHQSTGATRDDLQFAPVKTSPRHYTVVIPATAGKGDYGILPPGSYTSSNAASGGKIYTVYVPE
jgi:hypothetical protein